MSQKVGRDGINYLNRIKVLGVDPGFNGGLAVLEAGPDASKVHTAPMPVIGSGTDGLFGTERKTTIDLVNLAAWISKHLPLNLAVVEKVSSAPGQGVVSTFRFGEGFGMIQGILAASHVPMRLISPAVWKANLGLTSDKQLSINLVQELYGIQFLKKEDGLAEAVLLAHYGLSNILPGNNAYPTRSPF